MAAMLGTYRTQMLWDAITKGDLTAVINLLENKSINLEERDEVVEFSQIVLIIHRKKSFGKMEGKGKKKMLVTSIFSFLYIGFHLPYSKRSSSILTSFIGLM